MIDLICILVALFIGYMFGILRRDEFMHKILMDSRQDRWNLTKRLWTESGNNRFEVIEGGKEDD